ncbi:MAG: pseudouridine synthase, partial [Planctomycetota bacterium]
MSEQPPLVRLHKILAQAGIGSRRACETYIQEGRVQVDGKVVSEVGFQIDPEQHQISFNEQKISREAPVYYLLNKPQGVICTNDPKDPRPKITQMIHDRRRLFPVGRLDIDTEGLILLTNDGEMANRLAHPRYEVIKTYYLKVRGKMTPEDSEKLREGVWLDTGKISIPKFQITYSSFKYSSLTVTISEGKNRMIRRVFAKIQHAVLAIRRIRIGPLTIKGLSSGRYRLLSKREIDTLMEETASPKSRPDPYQKRKKSSNDYEKKSQPYPLKDHEEPETDVTSFTPENPLKDHEEPETDITSFTPENSLKDHEEPQADITSFTPAKFRDRKPRSSSDSYEKKPQWQGSSDSYRDRKPRSSS